MRLLIPVFSPAHPELGGLTRVIAVAEAAIKRGHQVAFCASGHIEATLRNRGYQVYAMPPSTVFGLPKSISHKIGFNLQYVTLPFQSGRSFGDIWLLCVLAGFARKSFLKDLVAEGVKAVRSFRANALFTDYDPTAFLLHQITGLPIACTYSSVFKQGTSSFSWKLMFRAIAPILKHYKQPLQTPDELLFTPSVFKIIPTIPELDDVDPSRSDVCYVGQLCEDIKNNSCSDFEFQDKKRYVFTYTGTGSISLYSLRKILPQIFTTNKNYICFVGAQSIKTPQYYGSVEFHPYVNAEEILPYCDWTICHGGQNTIVHSLRHSVPLIIFPGSIWERRYNAQKVEQTGAGFMGESNNLTVEWINNALKMQSECAKQAKILSDQIYSYGGADSAIEEIEQKFF